MDAHMYSSRLLKIALPTQQHAVRAEVLTHILNNTLVLWRQWHSNRVIVFKTQL